MSTQLQDASRVAPLSGAPARFDVREWVSSKVYRRGVDYFREGRVVVFELGDDDSIRAEVEGTESYDVEISWDEDGSPIAECSCPYDWEPLCKHAVAAILCWQDGGDGAGEDAEAAAEEEPPSTFFDRDRHIAELAEIEAKRRRSRKNLESIEVQRKPKGGVCGEYVVSSGTAKGSYSVFVRDPIDPGQTTCDCPDYLINELGTCKHIELVNEAVQRKVRRLKKSARADRRIWISVKPRGTYPNRTVSPLEEIHIHSGDASVRGRLFGKGVHLDLWWDADGYLCSPALTKTAEERLGKVLKAIQMCFGNGSAPEIVVAPQVRKLIAEIDAENSWKKKLDAIISDPSRSKEWHDVRAALPMKLYPYQEKGILFAARNRRSFIGDDMGLGKTVQAIAAALLVRRLAGVDKVLIFCPASLKFQWKREIEKVAGLKAILVEGSRREREKLYASADGAFLVVNYELIFRDEDLLHRLGPDMIILDEAQRIKNWETKTAKGIKRLKSAFALVLTGTPFENKLLELHSLCEFLHPRALGPMWRLLPTYGDLDADARIVGFTNLSHLRERMAPFFLRREKREVAGQLPDKVVNEYTVEISAAQKAHHDDYEAALARLLARARKRPLTPEEMKRVFMCLSAMRVISNALAQHEWEKHQPLIDVPGPLPLAKIRSFHSPKLLEFRSVMEELLARPGEKFVIFSQWERMLLLAEASIRDLLLARGMEAAIFSGSLKTSSRGKAVDRFINDPNLRVFFSTDAGGVGLNLQEPASSVINLEMPWNPAVLDQRIGRVHRLGQKRTVNVINFISTGCIEERVYQTLCNKRLLFDGLFDGETESVAFDRGQSFIERLKGMVGEGDDAVFEGEANEALFDRIERESVETDASVAETAGAQTASADTPVSKAVGAQAPDADAPIAPGDGTVTGQREFDLTALVKMFGALVGSREIAGCAPDAFKLKVEARGGEMSFTLQKPPAGFLSGVKGMLSQLSRSLDAQTETAQHS